MLETRNFSEEEFFQVISKSKDLMKKGYFTGVNFIQSEDTLPDSSILIHFLHNNQEQINYMQKNINQTHLVLPRTTLYAPKPEYFNKSSFTKEYKNAIFLDRDLKEICLEKAIKSPQDIIILNKEVDMLFPILKEKDLSSITEKICKVNLSGPDVWIDPVIIVKTKKSLNLLEGFVNKCFVGISKENEEFYCILSCPENVKKLKRYIDNLCNKTQIGEFQKSDVVFYPSQINKEFSEYIAHIESQL
ncbi:MAG: hypothetical protein PHE43_03145 [Candidatus Nanoarchaeia archaeon]|nr:hypothetical protein [Candidatus Nanoarchaeia archaeon]